MKQHLGYSIHGHLAETRQTYKLGMLGYHVQLEFKHLLASNI